LQLAPFIPANAPFNHEQRLRLNGYMPGLLAGKNVEDYLRHRQSGESFQKFTVRNDLNTLQAIFTNDE